MTEPVTVITGGPGVGKTTIIRAVCEAAAQKNLRVLLAAPTGRAAKRLEESTGRPARTLHRLLEFTPGLGRFTRDAQNPLDAELLVVDESSMLDVQLAASLLAAIPPSMPLVLVGDHGNQLPPSRQLDLMDRGELQGHVVLTIVGGVAFMLEPKLADQVSADAVMLDADTAPDLAQSLLKRVSLQP
jgi:exodeoxyribonuclease V alpha subunit